MWKALIKLVEKWAYRCDHNYIHAGTEKRFPSEDISKLPDRITHTYRCTKCCDFKITPNHTR